MKTSLKTAATKPKKRLKAILVDISFKELIALRPIFDEQRESGGAILAQIWKDGMRVTVVTKEMRAQIAQITGVDTPEFYKSAAAAHRDAVARETSNTEAA